MSGGARQAPRPVRAEFWEGVRSGLSPRDAGVALGRPKGADGAAGVNDQPGGAAERAAGAVPGAAGAGAGGGAGGAAEDG